MNMYSLMNRTLRADGVAVLLALCLLLWIAARPAVAEGMPVPPANPTIVKVGVFLADIIDLNEREENLEVELILVAEWEDPRLAFDAQEAGQPYRLYQGEFQFNEVFSGWWPQFLILNEVGSGDTNAISIRVMPSGKVFFKTQRNVRLETPMDLQTFPFDEQKLLAHIIPFGDYRSEVQLVVDQRVLGATEEYAETNKRVNIAQWQLAGVDLVEGVSDARYYGEKQATSQISLIIRLQRQSTSFLWKVIFPLVLLVSLMWAVFWMDMTDFADRLNIAFIGILTIVAYQFLIDGDMPRIDYFTFTDAVLLFSFVVMCLTIYESLLVYSFCKFEKHHVARKIDQTARWLFPAVYVGGVVLVYFYYLVTYDAVTLT